MRRTPVNPDDRTQQHVWIEHPRQRVDLDVLLTTYTLGDQVADNLVHLSDRKGRVVTLTKDQLREAAAMIDE